MAVSTRGILFIVSSPSGGGKTTLVRNVIARLGGIGIPAHFSVSHTTRDPRPAEVGGRDYHFVSRPDFERLVAQGAFLEWAEYAGSLYGTSRTEVEGRLDNGVDVFLDIEVQGANQVKTSVPDVVKVFVYPPSYDVLTRRLRERRQDSAAAIAERLTWARRELGAAGEFDYVIINDRLEEAVDALFGICLAEHHRPRRMTDRLDAIRRSFQEAADKDTEP